MLKVALDHKFNALRLPLLGKAGMYVYMYVMQISSTALAGLNLARPTSEFLARAIDRQKVPPRYGYG
jgi:hypothetical protein